MKKSMGICIMIFCVSMAWAGSDEAKQFASMTKKIQSVQDSIPPMLAKLESALQAQITHTQIATQKNIDAMQAQIAQLQMDTETKLAMQSKASLASAVSAQKNLQNTIIDLQGQIVALQRETDTQLVALNKAIAGSK